MAKIIRQGQKEGDIVKGDALYLADLYWGNVYLMGTFHMDYFDTLANYSVEEMLDAIENLEYI